MAARYVKLTVAAQSSTTSESTCSREDETGCEHVESLVQPWTVSWTQFTLYAEFYCVFDFSRFLQYSESSKEWISGLWKCLSSRNFYIVQNRLVFLMVSNIRPDDQEFMLVLSNFKYVRNILTIIRRIYEIAHLVGKMSNKFYSRNPLTLVFIFF